MSARRIRRGALVAILIVLLLIFIPPLVNLRGFQRDIEEAISRGIGRAVSAKTVGLELLPQPGLTLGDFVVQDDLAFSAEPMLRARQVTVRPRLSSLWRARLEIGSLSLKEPSLNLVRNAEGRWNIESLLNRATHIPSAPTGKARPEARPRFPYIQAEDGRINFKSGQEKTVYAFTSADFALWLESEDLWNMRLEARPMRTDANLSDTGVVRINGSFRRTDKLRDTPLNVRLSLERAQLGQLTRLLQGRDRGWRGSVNANVTLAGTPASLAITSDLSVDDFRRYDILSDDALRLAAHCTARYHMDPQGLTGINCRLPQGNGTVDVRGAITSAAGERSYEVGLVAHDVPMAEVMRLARHAKRGLPGDFNASGRVNAEFLFRSSGEPGMVAASWTGSGSVEEFTVEAPALASPLQIGEVEFSAAQVVPVPQAGKRVESTQARQMAPAGVVIGPFSLPLGGSNPVSVKALLTRSDYTTDIDGEADLRRLMALVRSLGGRAPQLDIKGSANLDLAVSGRWSGFAAPTSTGTLLLHAATLQILGTNAPLRVKSAKVTLTPDDVNVQNLSAAFAGSRSDWSGSVQFPRACTADGGCPVHLDLHTDEVSVDDLNRLFNPLLQKRAWYQFKASPRNRLAAVDVDGRIAADRVVIKGVNLNRVAAQVTLAGGKLSLTGLRGDVFGGALRGVWTADFTGNMPVYSGEGRVEHAALARISEFMHDDWATGTVNGSYRFRASGWTEPELLTSALASVDVAWLDGALRHIVLEAGASPLRVKRFLGHAEWRDGKLEFSLGRMETPDGIYSVSGTAGRQLNLKLQSHDAHAYSVSGTLEKPLVTPVTAAETQAALKP